ncbi:hypothetical protein C8Q74DRAFT_1310653 [Fomes fomentarius]|nr:hypothetical protein C8Q74DRAFT_1310653 [Fomes fomentarius]
MPTLFYVNTTLFLHAVQGVEIDNDATVVHLTEPVPDDPNISDRMKDYASKAEICMIITATNFPSCLRFCSRVQRSAHPYPSRAKMGWALPLHNQNWT